MNYHDLDKIRQAMKDVRETCVYRRKQLGKPSLVLPRLAVMALFFASSVVVKLTLHSFGLGLAVASVGTFVAILL